MSEQLIGSTSIATLPRLAMTGRRPLAPRVSVLTEHFWSRLADGEFNLPCCEACSRLTFPPKLRCQACGSRHMGWRVVSGDAKVYSSTTVHAAPQLFAQEGAYVLAVLDLAEGVRLVTRWVGPAPACGAPARLKVLNYDDGVLFGAGAWE